MPTKLFPEIVNSNKKLSKFSGYLKMTLVFSTLNNIGVLGNRMFEKVLIPIFLMLMHFVTLIFLYNEVILKNIHSG